jgi:transcriptional regulator with XRE-family HTH domain
MRCNVKDLRDRKQLSLSGLALEAGLNKGRVSEIERGIRRPTQTEKQALEEALGSEVIQWIEVPARD